MSGRVIDAFVQLLDGAGDPLSSGWLRFLEPGSNNTDKNTFADVNLQIPNANPLRLDGDGRCPSVFGSGSYRVISFENDPDDESNPGQQVQMFDPVDAQEGASSGAGTTFDTWSSLVTYGIGDLVTSNNEYYRSIITGNLNNNPAIDTFAWEKVDFLAWWNASISYSVGDLVRGGADLFFSYQALNLNHDPDTSPTWWRRLQAEVRASVTKTASYTVLATERDTLFVLGAATAADSTFTLPPGGAGVDGYRLSFYNASNFDLTIDGPGGSAVWIAVAATVTIEKGSMLELRYDSTLDTWMPVGNVGPVLGGQNLGTSALPMLDGWMANLTLSGAIAAATGNFTTVNTTTITATNYGNINATTLTVTGLSALAVITGTTLTATGAISGASLAATGGISGVNLTLSGWIKQPDAALHYFGTSDDAHIVFNGSTFDINSGGNPLRLQGAATWQIDGSGHFVPGGNIYNLGSATGEINNFYVRHIYLGLGQEGEVYHDSSDLTVATDTGGAYFGTTDVAGNVFLTAGGVARWAITAAGVLGSVFLEYDIGTSAGQIGNMYVGDNKISYYGASQDGGVYFATSGSVFNVRGLAAGANLQLGAGSGGTIAFSLGATVVWGFNLGGAFVPTLNNTVDIGQVGGTVKDIYSLGVYNSSVTGRNVYVATSGQIGYLSSAAKDKQNIVDIPDTSWIYSLKPARFNRIGSDEPEVGFVAEEVEQVNSDFVFYDGKDPAGVRYRQINVALLAEVQRLADRVKQLEATT